MACFESSALRVLAGWCLLAGAAAFATLGDSEEQPAAAAKPNPIYTFKADHDPDGIGKFYFGREISHVMGHLAADWLERPSRIVEEAPAKLIESLQLKPSMTVADIGAGSGYFTRRIARKIQPDGLVYAVEIQSEMLEILEANMKRHQLKNFRSVLGTERDPKLPASSVDLVLMVDVYHEFSFPHEMMTKIHQALKPDGKVVFVEYRGEDPKVPIKPLHKMTEAQVKKEAKAQGFSWIKTLDVLPRQHIIFFEKRKAAAPPPENEASRRPD